MLIFKFAGHLRRHFRKVELSVDTPAQGIRLLLAQNQEFKKSIPERQSKNASGG